MRRQRKLKGEVVEEEKLPLSTEKLLYILYLDRTKQIVYFGMY